MTTYRFVLRLDRPPGDAQLQRLFRLAGDVCVEVGAWRRGAAALVERAAPSAVDAVVAAVRDLDRSAIVAVEACPDRDLAPAWLVAERIGCTPGAVLRWAVGESGPGEFPRPVELPGRPAYYRCAEVAGWLRDRLGHRCPDRDGPHGPLFAAVTLALRLRAAAPAVDPTGAVRSLADPYRG